MLSFKEYNNLEENFLKNFFKSKVRKFVSKMKKIFSKISFGKKKSMSLRSLRSIAVNENVDFKSRLGYLSEYSTALELSKIIAENNLRVTPRTQTGVLQRIYNQKKQELIRLKAPSKEITRQEVSGKVIAKQIFEDVISSLTDLDLLTFDIEMTGDAGKGKTKADIMLHITKDSEKEVVDKVMASLKAYKSSSINLSNSTFISLIKTLFYDNPSSLPKSSKDFIERFSSDFGSREDLSRLLDLQNFIGTRMKAGDDKASARKLAKTYHGEVIEIISKIFNTYYAENKKSINERMLKMLGFDGDDDFYAAIGSSENMSVISSRDSKELQVLIQQLKNGFDLSIERNGETNNANVVFSGPDKKVFIKGTITFADTGGKNPQGKTNTFVDFRKFIKK